MWDVKIFFQQECIPVGCVPSAAVAVGGGLPRGLSAWGVSAQRVGSAWGVSAPVHAEIHPRE